MLCLTLQSIAQASFPPLEGAALSWYPPTLSNAITVNVSDTNRRLFLDDTRDYRLQLKSPVKKELWIEGGRNVVVVGGQITIDELGASTRYKDNTALKIRGGDPSGTVHVEGLLIDGRYVNDAIAIATQRTVQIENVRIERVYDRIKGGHGDCLQIQQGVGTLRVDRFTCTTERQGFFLDDTYAHVGWIDIRNADITGSPGKHLFFQTTATTGPVRLTQVWLGTGRPWAPFGWWVYPTAAGADGSPSRRAVVTSDSRGRARFLTFVNSNILGRINQGQPPNGEFVPSGVAGIGYVSPLD